MSYGKSIKSAMENDMETLIQEAKDIIEKRYKKEKHPVGAAVRTKSSKIYTGVSLNSQKVDVCSEWVAIGQAITQGDSDIEMVVAVKRDQGGNFKILPPCALCRELYMTYCPEAQIIIAQDKSIKASELLPNAWLKGI